jgi:hypothetical protein
MMRIKKRFGLRKSNAQCVENAMNGMKNGHQYGSSGRLTRTRVKNTGSIVVVIGKVGQKKNGHPAYPISSELKANQTGFMCPEIASHRCSIF